MAWMGQDWFCRPAKIPEGDIMFCPKCGSLLKSKKIGQKTLKYCECGFKEKGAEPEIMSSDKQTDPDEVRFDVVEQDDSERIHPIDSEAVCPNAKTKELISGWSRPEGLMSQKQSFLSALNAGTSGGIIIRFSRL